MNLGKVLLHKWKADRKNSSMGDKGDQITPPAPRKLAIKIESFYVELPTSQLKNLKLNQEISFLIDAPMEWESLLTQFCGEGSGQIKEIIDFNDSLADDEYQEIQLVLEDGMAEER